MCRDPSSDVHGTASTATNALKHSLGFLVGDTSPVWPAGIPVPEEAEDKGLLVGEDCLAI